MKKKVYLLQLMLVVVAFAAKSQEAPDTDYLKERTILLTGGTVGGYKNFTPDPDMWAALRLKAQWRLEEALKIFNQVLSTDQNNIVALDNSSLILCNLSHGLDKETRRDYIELAKVRAQRSRALDSTNWQAQFNYVVALGMLTEVAHNPWEKVKNIKLIERGSIKMIEMAPDSAQGYFILGKWNFGLAKLSWVERTAVDVLFGGIPDGASFEKSIKNYQRALYLKPNEVIVHLGIAETWYHIGDTAQAVNSLRAALALPGNSFNDHLRKRKCQQLLKQWKSS